MAENCSSLEPWVYRAPFADGLWMSDTFMRDTESLTRALQICITSSSSSSPLPTPTLTPSSLPCAKQEPATSDSGSRRKAAIVASGPNRKASKSKKSRASKRSPTTFITADPANFRKMVQHVTGVTLGDEAIPVTDMVGARPASKRSATGSASTGRVVITDSCLPTLDTSAFLLGREARPSTVRTEDQGHDQQQNQQILPAADAGAASFQCVPTLESWGVM